MRDAAPRAHLHVAGVAARPVARRAKRVKLRAREQARLQCQNLELDIMNLRQEIASLTTLRSLLYARTLHRPDDVHGRFEKIVREFYALNADGYQDTLWRPDAACVDVLKFMQSHFDSALAIDTAAASNRSGLNTFLMMLGSMTTVLDRPVAEVLTVRVHQSDADGLATVDATSQCTSFLTSVLLDKLFPDMKEFAPWLRERLIGRELVTIAEGRFTFDLRRGLIVRVDLRVDHAPSIVRIVETLDVHEIQLSENPTRHIDATEITERFKEIKDDQVPTEVRPSQSPMSLERLLSPQRDDDEEKDECGYALSA